MSAPVVIHKTVGGEMIASIKTIIQKRTEILPLFNSLQEACGDAICGSAIAILYYGSVKDGLLVEAAYPVTCEVEKGEVHSRTLELRKAWTMIHAGSHDTMRETTAKILEYVNAHAGTIGGGTREIYLDLDPAHPEACRTEVQVLDHEWDQRLAHSVEEVLGAEARQHVMVGIDTITTESSSESYRDWIHAAMGRIDELTSDPEKKYEIVSCCAHVFPQYRIDHLRRIYEQRREIDDVLREMYTDPDWYENPVRKGSQLYMRKVPFDAEGYKKAATPVEKRQAYCHCAFVRPYLTESPAKISPTFCWCGAGWYRRLWEGVLGKLIQIVHVNTLVRGNDFCDLVITLPISAEGEFTPEMVHEKERG